MSTNRYRTLHADFFTVETERCTFASILETVNRTSGHARNFVANGGDPIRLKKLSIRSEGRRRFFAGDMVKIRMTNLPTRIDQRVRGLLCSLRRENREVPAVADDLEYGTGTAATLSQNRQVRTRGRTNRFADGYSGESVSIRCPLSYGTGRRGEGVRNHRRCSASPARTFYVIRSQNGPGVAANP